jgi:hypothetical protein
MALAQKRRNAPPRIGQYKLSPVSALQREPNIGQLTTAHTRTVESSFCTKLRVVPPVYLQTVSRPIELSLQSSLQLSLTVLVCYRSRCHI